MAGFGREVELHLRDLRQRLSDCSNELEHLESSPISPCLFSPVDRTNLLRAAKEAARACDKVEAVQFHHTGGCKKPKLAVKKAGR